MFSNFKFSFRRSATPVASITEGLSDMVTALQAAAIDHMDEADHQDNLRHQANLAAIEARSESYKAQHVADKIAALIA